MAFYPSTFLFFFYFNAFLGVPLNKREFFFSFGVFWLRGQFRGGGGGGGTKLFKKILFVFCGGARGLLHCIKQPTKAPKPIKKNFPQTEPLAPIFYYPTPPNAAPKGILKVFLAKYRGKPPAKVKFKFRLKKTPPRRKKGQNKKFFNIGGLFGGKEGFGFKPFTKGVIYLGGKKLLRESQKKKNPPFKKRRKLFNPGKRLKFCPPKKKTNFFSKIGKKRGPPTGPKKKKKTPVFPTLSKGGGAPPVSKNHPFLKRSGFYIFLPPGFLLKKRAFWAQNVREKNLQSIWPKNTKIFLKNPKKNQGFFTLPRGD